MFTPFLGTESVTLCRILYIPASPPQFVLHIAFLQCLRVKVLVVSRQHCSHVRLKVKRNAEKLFFFKEKNVSVYEQ